MSQKKKVSFLGPGTGSFGFQALASYFSDWKVNPMEYNSHIDVCKSVGQMHADFGVVAVENVIDGVVSETVRAVERTDSQFGLKICGEEMVLIDMRLIAKRSVNIETVKRIISHSVGINQCGKAVTQLQKQGIEVVMVNSTAEAARIASEDKTAAALASPRALNIHKELQDIGKKNMVDHLNSKTRFWILSKKQSHFVIGRKFKTCFLANFDHDSVGVIHKTLGLFAERNINVLLIHPSPILGKEWEYTFVIEVEGHVLDPIIQEAWEAFCILGISLQPLRFLGSYQSRHCLQENK